MAKKAKEKLKNPNGLSIKRNKNVFTFSWKRGNDYTDQQVQYYNYSKKKWVTVKGIKPKTTAVSVKFDLSVSRKKVKFRVRGKFDKKWSDYKKAAKLFEMTAPSKPTSASSRTELENRSTFSWKLATSDTNTKPFDHVVWQSVLLKESTITKGEKVKFNKKQYGWKTGTSKSADSSTSITELTTDVLDGSSVTRWFKVWAVGAGGPSAPAYSSMRYAAPKKVSVKTAKLTKQTNAAYTCTATWSAGQDNGKRPISKVVVQYCVTVPDEGFTVPSDASWEEGSVSADCAGTDKSIFTIPNRIEKDEVVFVKVNAIYRDRETEGDVKMASRADAVATYGDLKDPSDVSVVLGDNYQVRINATNNSEVPDSFLAVVYESKDNPDDNFVIGIIPKSDDHVIVQCPEWTSEPAFGVYAVAGSYSESERDDGVSSYDITAKMKSKNTIWKGGAVPTAPSNVNVEPTAIVGTIRVTWDWSWDEADSAVLSWADHSDAWESTDEPEEYTVSNLHAPRWNISGLATGKTWYVAVKLMSGETSSPWSDPIPIALTSAPAITTLNTSSDVITEDGDLTFSWSYFSTDGTDQMYADICEVSIDDRGNIDYMTYVLSEDTEVDDTKTYYDDEHQEVTPTGDEDPSEEGWYEYKLNIRAHTTTEQQVTVTPADMGWKAGDTKYLSLRTASMSEKISDWSEPVSIIVVDRLVADIPQTSLEYTHIEDNPQTFTGDIVEIENENGAMQVTGLSVTLEPIQDLNGYDKPWSGGNGKNVLDLSGQSGDTVNGVTFTINNDGSIHAKGTATAQANYYVFPANGYVIPDGTWTLSITDDSNIAVWVVGGGNNTSGLAYAELKNGRNKTFTTSGGGIGYFIVRIPSGATIDEDIKLQIEQGSTATSWTPYSNICPISGHTDVVTHRTGKNWFDSSLMRDQAGWNIIPIKVKPNTAYTCSTNKPSDNELLLYFKRVSAGGGSSIEDTYSGKPVTQTSTEDGYVYISQRRASGTKSFSDYWYQIELGSTATDYEPYQGDVYTTDLGQTVYGGTLDVVSGELVVDRAMVDLGTLTWSRYTPSATNIPVFYASVSGMLKANEGASLPLCSSYRCEAWTDLSRREDGTIQPHPTLALIYVADSRFDNADSFASAVQGVQLVYELAEPQTIQLTPQEVELLTGTNNLWSDGEITVKTADNVRDGYLLTKMPLTITTTGAGESGQTTITVSRRGSYHVDRPDESEFNGYEDETIATQTFAGDGTVTFDVPDLIGSFDDTADYRIVSTIKDEYGQTDTAQIEFDVAWEHQASAPASATVEIDEENLIAKLSATAPSDALYTDMVDIYRLSADKPELVVSGGAFGTVYVDPYPAINGGYRFVTRTADGDYISPDNIPAWIDIDSEWDYDRAIIDFDGQQVQLYYNLDLSNNWEKSFQATRYLGGTIRGDWDEGVNRTATLSTVAFTEYDADVIDGMRDLAEYAGICHIRTLDGSSFSADLQVQEDRDHDDYRTRASFSISGTRVAPEEEEGMTFEEWNEGN